MRAVGLCLWAGQQGRALETGSEMQVPRSLPQRGDSGGEKGVSMWVAFTGVVRKWPTMRAPPWPCWHVPIAFVLKVLEGKDSDTTQRKCD